MRIALAGERTGQVEACEPPQRLLLTMRDPDPQPGQPEQTVIEAQLIAEGAVAVTWLFYTESRSRELSFLLPLDRYCVSPSPVAWSPPP